MTDVDLEITRNTLRSARTRLEGALERNFDSDAVSNPFNPNELIDVGYLTRSACMLLIAMLDCALQELK